MAMADYYADVIGNISVTGHLVRIDFLSQALPASEQQGVQLQVSHRVVMPLEGFLRSLETQEQVRTKLIADGIVKLSKKNLAEPIDAARKASTTI
jgi:hypothetical protein